MPQIRSCFNSSARRAPIFFYLCVLLWCSGFARLRAQESPDKPLTYANLQGSWSYTGEKMLFLDTGKVEIRKNRNPYESPTVFTDKPVMDGKGGFFLFKYGQTRYGERYEIVDADHLRISDKNLYRVRLTATTLILIRRTETMEFTSYYQRTR